MRKVSFVAPRKNCLQNALNIASDCLCGINHRSVFTNPEKSLEWRHFKIFVNYFQTQFSL